MAWTLRAVSTPRTHGSAARWTPVSLPASGLMTARVRSHSSIRFQLSNIRDAIVSGPAVLGGPLVCHGASSSLACPEGRGWWQVYQDAQVTVLIGIRSIRAGSQSLTKRGSSDILSVIPFTSKRCRIVAGRGCGSAGCRTPTPEAVEPAPPHAPS